MKILLFGKNGQVGWELQRSLAPLGQVIALDRRSPELCGDLADLRGIAETVRRVRPDVIVNAAAFTAVDKAESEAGMAHLVNAEAPGVLAEAASALGAWMVHYSTDYVFDGSGGKPWEEIDSTGPLNVYGRTKLEGEQCIAAQCAKHLIMRTSWVYGARRTNFAETMLRMAAEYDCFGVIDDQFGAPTGADLLADVTSHVIRQVLQRSADAGLYHLAASGETSWYAYAKHVLWHAQTAEAATRVKSAKINPIPSSGFPSLARRPHNSRLDTRKLQTVFGLRLPPWEQGVDRMLNEV